MADVFISYVHEDRNVAHRLADAISASGWTVWWDRSLLPGQSFYEVIESELEAAKAVIVLWSGRSVRSDWVRDEAQQAKQRQILIQCLVERVTPPLGFRQTQCADLHEWTGDVADERFVALRRGLARIAPPREAERTNESTSAPVGHSLNEDGPPHVSPRPTAGPSWLGDRKFTKHWRNVPEGSTLIASARASINRDAVAIDIVVRSSSKYIKGFGSRELLSGEQCVRLTEDVFFLVELAISTFGKSEIVVHLRVETPDGLQFGEPVKVRSYMEPNTEHRNFAIQLRTAADIA